MRTLRFQIQDKTIDGIHRAYHDAYTRTARRPSRISMDKEDEATFIREHYTYMGTYSTDYQNRRLLGMEWETRQRGDLDGIMWLEVEIQ